VPRPRECPGPRRRRAQSLTRPAFPWATVLLNIRMAGNRDPDSGDEDDLLVSWLTSLSYDDLVAEIVDLADGDAGTRALLEARAAAQTADDLISEGAADEAIGLAREAFTLASQMLANVGAVPESLADAARELLDVHLRACQAADPPP